MMQARPPKMRATAMVFGHNQAHFIEETIFAVLDQNFEGLEVILSDNGSSDNTFEIMSQIALAYAGPHKIVLNKNKVNLGFIGHINQAFKLASAKFIIYNPGDDISLPNRFEKLWAEYKKTNALLVHSDVIEITDTGQKKDIKSQREFLKNINLFTCSKKMSLCIGATCGWDKDLVNIFGEISETDTYDDLIFYFRAKLAGERIGYVPEPLMLYRVGSGITNSTIKTYSEKIMDQKRKSLVEVGTLKQRLKDCETYAPELVRLIKFIKFRMKVSRGRSQAYQGESLISILKTFSLGNILGYILGWYHFKRAFRKHK